MLYSSYLQTVHWQAKRREKLSDKNCCQICKSSNNLHIHHKHYDTKEGKSIYFQERKEDLITLCGSCHSLWHKYIKELRKSNKKICRIRRLLELGIIKNKAFWLVGNPEVYKSAYQFINQ